ncbi:hypothetical protein LTR01_008930 [Friedmanniomyces endolithicus]|nr:hypothetical protein LTR01_008930 [Friedmanniomyces endolithicus]KAK0822881.1 hypothetical protein LTR73_008969 [Friedmanniomyces endolithicus]
MSWTEQVVVVLPTGAGKSLLFMLPPTLTDAGITVLVVLSLRFAGISSDWLPGERREASLILATAEAASSRDFLKYARSLIAQQKLDRIVVDECHLTVTAAHYRVGIVDMTRIRVLRTQFVYLTATLPPSMQEEFIDRNHLLRPTSIRASSNRSNLLYMVRRVQIGHGSHLEQAAAEARDAWERSGLFNASRDKIILHVRTRDETSQLAGILGCATYTARSGSTAEKTQVIARWIASRTQPFLVATSAFPEGFDYPHVRLVINVNEPDSLVLFAQESGRAGRDGERAYSLVILPSEWKAMTFSTDGQGDGMILATQDESLGKLRERRAMQQYLDGRQCFRTSLSEHLDAPEHRRWCMAGEVPCDICQSGHEDMIGPNGRQQKIETANNSFTGEMMVQRARQKDLAELADYQEDLKVLEAIGGIISSRLATDGTTCLISEHFRVSDTKRKEDGGCDRIRHVFAVSARNLSVVELIRKRLTSVIRARIRTSYSHYATGSLRVRREANGFTTTLDAILTLSQGTSTGSEKRVYSEEGGRYRRSGWPPQLSQSSARLDCCRAAAARLCSNMTIARGLIGMMVICAAAPVALARMQGQHRVSERQQLTDEVQQKRRGRIRLEPLLLGIARPDIRQESSQRGSLQRTLVCSFDQIWSWRPSFACRVRLPRARNHGVDHSVSEGAVLDFLAEQESINESIIFRLVPLADVRVSVAEYLTVINSLHVQCHHFE